MNKKQYVRHISGQGGKWLLQERAGYNSEKHADWCVHRDGYGTLFLPKSEYVLIEPPEVWTDVTAQLTAACGGIFDGPTLLYEQSVAGIHQDYRLRKVPGHELVMVNGLPPCAFIVERRQP